MRRRDPPAVGAERHRGDRPAMACKREGLLTGRRSPSVGVPDDHGPILAPGREAPAGGGERDAVSRAE